MSMLTFILYACGGGGSGISISNVSSDGVNAFTPSLETFEILIPLPPPPQA